MCVEFELDARECLLFAVDGERGNHLTLVEGQVGVVGHALTHDTRAEQLVDVRPVVGVLGEAQADEAAQVVRVGHARWRLATAAAAAAAQRQTRLGEGVAR